MKFQLIKKIILTIVIYLFSVSSSHAFYCYVGGLCIIYGSSTKCAQDGGVNFGSFTYCNQNCSQAYWIVGSWGACTCYQGTCTQTRPVSCSAGASKNCGLCPKPATTQSCVSSDKTAPNCGSWSPTVSPWKNSGTQTFTLSGSTDSGTGIWVGSGTCTTGNNHGSTCNVIIKDHAANTRTCTSPINRIDAITPSANYITDYQTLYGSTGQKVPITLFEISDSGGSGLNNLRWAYFPPGSSAWIYTTVANTSSTATFNIPVTVAGTYSVAVAIQDNAGNWSNFNGDNYKRTSFTINFCTPTTGTCATGEYTTAAAAIGTGTCKYGYTSYTTTNASCSGSNITCYRRLAVYTNPINGSCALGEQTTACTSSQIQINTYTTTNAACGGTNITCYQCSLATCSSINLNDNGDPDCRYCLDKNDDQCPSPSPTPIPDPENICTIKPNQNDPNKCVLITNADGSLSVSCATTSSTNPYIFYQGNDSGDGTKNYRPIACSELGPEYTTADKCTSSQLPIPIDDFCDGDLYFKGIASQCVTCLDVSAPWFQAVNGNIYAKGTIESEVNFSEVPVMRNNDPSCATDSALLSGVGVPVAGNKVINITSQNNNGVIANFSSGFANIDPEDYKFFARYFGYTAEELADPDNVKRCPSDLNNNDNNLYTLKDAFICLIQPENNLQANLSDFLPDTTGSGDTETPLRVPAGIKKVIFVNGDILLDRKIILEPENETQEAGFLMFIVAGDIEVSSYLGDFLTEANFAAIGGSCAQQAPALHGIFIANGSIIFSGGGVNNAFTNSTVNRNCDKKLTVKGSYIGWGRNKPNQSGILMSRTFLGCVPGSFADPEVPTYTDYNLNYNSKTPVLTFIYDTNLLNRLPNWINKPIWQRFEVN